MTLLIPKHVRPVTPGEILVEEFLVPLGLTQTAFAERIGVTYPRLNEIVNGKRGVSTDTALRFAKALGTTPDFWLNAQRVVDMYDILNSKSAAQIQGIKPVMSAPRRRRPAKPQQAAYGRKRVRAKV